jgi:hypothetical protein
MFRSAANSLKPDTLLEFDPLISFPAILLRQFFTELLNSQPYHGFTAVSSSQLGANYAQPPAGASCIE